MGTIIAAGLGEPSTNDSRCRVVYTRWRNTIPGVLACGAWMTTVDSFTAVKWCAKAPLDERSGNDLTIDV